MSQDFVRPASPAWDKIADESTNVEELRERMKAKLVADGFVVRERGYEIGSDVLTHEAENAAPANPSGASIASNFKFEREVRFAEFTGRRSMVIRANTLADLDALENLVTR
jgi:hypothetical protein